MHVPAAHPEAQPKPSHIRVATVDGQQVASDDAARVFKLTFASNAHSKVWTERELSLDDLRDMVNPESRAYRDDKDGICFVAATLLDGKRNLKSVDEIHVLVYDVDGAQSLEEVDALAGAFDRTAFLYTTHSHRTVRTEVVVDHYEAWAKKANERLTPTLSTMLAYLADKGKGFLQNLRFDPSKDFERVADKGNCYIITHDPIDKARVLLPLATPILLSKLSANNKRANEIYVATYKAIGNAIGLDFDPTCTDPCRLFYLPSCPEKMAKFAKSREYDGGLLEWEEYKSAPSEGKELKQRPKSNNASSGKSSFKGLNLKAWAAQYAKIFDIEKLMEARGLALAPRNEGGVFVECFQEEAHTSPNPPRTWAVNGDGEKGFVIFCHGAGGDDVACKDVDRLDKIKGYIATGKFTAEDLQDPEYGGGPISSRAYYEQNRAGGIADVRAVDRVGVGLNVEVFHASVIAKPGLFDFAELNERCNVQVDVNVTIQQLVEFIETSRITVDDLSASMTLPKKVEQEPVDPYVAALRSLAARQSAITAREFEREMTRLGEEFGVSKKGLAADFKATAASVSEDTEIPGLLSEEDAALVKPLREYKKRFAIINTGGKGVVMNLHQADLSTAIMPRDDFEFLHRHEWFEVGDRTFYPAKAFLEKPPRGVQVYDKLVFKPSGTVGAKEYNLFKGFLLEPDESGSCDLFHELLREVWCANDPDAFEWVREHFMHIFAHPGEKVRTSIAIRGSYGDGKSIVTEKLFAPILGDLQLRVANQRLVLGDFNEAMVGKLVVTLEEAAFAGDKAAFDRLKEQVTGDMIVINPKFKAPITIDNHARMLVVSNHAHFMYIKPFDRRYTVLESTDAWNGTQKFPAMLEQWTNGGAQRFLYECENHSFRKFDDGRQLVINSNLKTEAATRQVALSRSPLDKCVVGFLLSGNFRSFRTGEPLLIGEDGGLVGVEAQLWKMGEPLELTSQVLEMAVVQCVREYDAQAARFLTLNTIVAAFEECLGKDSVAARRPKSARSEGERKQLPTSRTFPKRQDAIVTAWRRGMITDLEFDSVLDSSLRPAARDANTVRAAKSQNAA